MAQKPQPPKSRKVRRDESVIATNNSSIVSKRSVERLYYPEPHFFRYFVHKPLRRSPLINRGYWLRMHAVEQVIKQFLDEPSERRKIVLNLGCGYDPLAFQSLSKDTFRCQRTKFVDVDFPELISKKLEIIVKTPQLRDLLGPHEIFEDGSGINLRSEHYSALGCDLTDFSKLDRLLVNEMDTSESLILCTAEVSLTYMDVEAADLLIQWASRHDHIRFCLLEQHLPDGAEHPFAQKMIQHFDNLNTPLRSLAKYPTLRDQELRFRQRGWASAIARSLWDIWSDPTFVSPKQRTALDSVEPFDEWEEFVLFSSHYFLLVAGIALPKKSPFQEDRLAPPCLEERSGHIQCRSKEPIIAHSQQVPKVNVRRFGALFPVSSDVVGYHGGLGSQSRMDTVEYYGHAESGNSVGLKAQDVTGIPPRMCHTITAVNQHCSLLVGGRTSPINALNDCWVFREGWIRADDLPMTLFRHCATQVDFEVAEQKHTGVLIYGGKTKSNTMSDKWMLWRESFGWIELHATGHDLTARFGAAMASTGPGEGLLIGGINSDGTTLSEIREWSIFNSGKALGLAVKSPSKCSLVQSPSYHDSGSLMTKNVMERIGACLINCSLGMLLIGGVSAHNLVQEMDYVRLTKEDNNENGLSNWHYEIIDVERDSRRPLLVGHSSAVFGNEVVTVGGGAVCFSFGTYWSHCLVTLSINEEQRSNVRALDVLKAEQIQQCSTSKEADSAMSSAALNHMTASTVNSERIGSALEFDRIIDQGRPVVSRNCELGSCITYWTADALRAKVGTDRAVVVHEAFNTHMDFQAKNFRYVRKPFAIFVDEISRGSRQYLRSLASNDPSEKPADFWADFPELRADFKLPPQYETVQRNMHSAVLRISGPVAIWLHYDVMANVLCQIQGKKRLILFPPSDVSLFSIPPGASSSSINCFDPDAFKGHLLSSAHPQEIVIGPGDVLFIPPLWLHTALPIDTVSISVNVFFRNLGHGYAPGRDVYGNRDLQAYEKGRRDIVKIAGSFDKLPPDARRFYLERLADELKVKARRYGI